MMPIPAFKVNFFWKTLFWFWLSFALTFILHLLILQMTDESTRYERTSEKLLQQLEYTKERMQLYIAKDENKKLSHHPRVEHIFLLQEDGTDWLGKPVPKLLVSLNKRVNNRKKIFSVIANDRIIYGGITIVEKGESYRIYVRRIFSYLSQDYMASFFREFAYSILISVFLISFPLSFFLAWFVVSPIKRLRAASREISKDIKNKQSIESLLLGKGEFAELAKDFEAMRQQIEQQFSARSRLISDVSHELRSPLARMQIAIGIANNKLNKDEKNTELERIKLEADKMNCMLTELLDYSKIDNLQDENLDELIDIKKLFLNLVDDAKFEAEQVGVTIATKLPENVFIKGSKLSLLSCFENIVRNAIRYANSNIKLTCYNNETKNVISIIISDDGSGVPPEDINQIFDAFYRPELDRSRQSGGVGLGLSIASKAVAAHDGRIWAENDQPKGFSIHIEFPLKPT